MLYVRTMFHNQTFRRRLIHKTGPVIFLTLIISIIVAWFLYLWRERERMRRLYDKTLHFEDLIFDYVKSIQKMDDKMATVLLGMIKFDTEFLSVTKVDSFGFEVPNYKWNTNAEAFMDVILRVQEMMVLTCNERSEHYKSSRVWKVVEHFIDIVMQKIPNKPTNHKFPWGENWFQFSITFPRFLMIVGFLHRRLYKKPHARIESHLANVISNYYKRDPENKGIISMGWLRDGHNAVMMSVPYIGGKLLMKTFDYSDPIIKYIFDYINLNYTTSGDGLYHDGGVIFHGGKLRALGYLYSAIEDFVLLSRFFEKLIDKIKRVFDIFEHPTIPLHFSAFFTRTGSLSNGGKVKGKLGFFVVDSLKAVIAKTPDWYLSFNGQRNSLCYYEADQANNRWGQLWLMARQFLYKHSDTQWDKDLVTYYPGVISYNNYIETIASNEKTTDTKTVIDAKTMICLADGAIGMRNYYKVIYDRFNLEVVELILITKLGYHVYYCITPDQMRHANEPITISVNLGIMDTSATTTGNGRGFVFEDNTSFVYGGDNVINTKTIHHPKTNVAMTSLQILPEDDEERDDLRVSFSNIHSATNEIEDDPKENMIKTHSYVLKYEPENPNFLCLYNKKKQTVAVTHFNETYSETTSVPSQFLINKFGLKCLDKHNVFNGTVIKSTRDSNQIDIENVTFDE